MSHIQELKEVAAKLEDQTNLSKISNRDIPPAGKTVCRFIEYVELGLQPQRPYAGKEKKPAEMVRLVFELLGEGNIREIEVDGIKKKISDKIYLSIPKIMSDKSRFYKLFTKMRYGRTDITHIAQMIGEAFQVTLRHTKSKDGDRTYVDITAEDGTFTLEPPFIVVPGKANITLDVPESVSNMNIFLFSSPTKDAWDSMFIEGTFEKDGVSRSKNFIQETILKALNFKGSAVDNMLHGSPSVNAVVNKMGGSALDDVLPV